MIPLEHSSSPEFMRKDSMTMDLLNGGDSVMDDEGTPGTERKKERSTKQRDPEKLKDTKHSSKNEGQHTDRRYLCYICHKLFTRRRSVRDHLNKIHGEKTWEPQKSLEVVVEPHSGEPIESIEEIIARGPKPPPPRSAKPSKPPKDDNDERAETEDKDAEEIAREIAQQALPALEKQESEVSQPAELPTVKSAIEPTPKIQPEIHVEEEQKEEVVEP